MSSNLSRRRFLTGLGAGAGAGALSVAAAGNAAAIGLEREPDEPERPPLQTQTVEFDGEHQAGIATPAQANLWLIATGSAGSCGCGLRTRGACRRASRRARTWNPRCTTPRRT